METVLTAVGSSTNLNLAYTEKQLAPESVGYISSTYRRICSSHKLFTVLYRVKDVFVSETLT